jgi:hypothetical protein
MVFLTFSGSSSAGVDAAGALPARKAVLFKDNAIVNLTDLHGRALWQAR